MSNTRSNSVVTLLGATTFSVGDKINSGCYGDVFAVRDQENAKMQTVIKFNKNELDHKRES
jgi:hypothetical protein